MEVKKTGKTCKGLVFRAFQNLYFSYSKFELTEKRGFRLLQRKSCQGCEGCYGLYDHVRDVLSCYESGDFLPIEKVLVDEFKEYTVKIEGSEGEEVTFIPKGE